MVEKELMDTYTLSTGAQITSLITYKGPIDEYRAAFTDRARPFLFFYAIAEGGIRKRTMTRGEFWDMASLGAAYLSEQGLSKGDRVVHGFSDNSLYDLVFRLAAVLAGCVPVTINWQADDNERLRYKASVTGAKLFIYNRGFAKRVEEISSSLPGMAFFDAEALPAYEPATTWISPPLSYGDEKMIIFTAGTTGLPKGVKLPHQSYLANRLTFEEYFRISPSTPLTLLLVNPLHHTNSSALSDWGMRRAGATIHLVERYSSPYWEILAGITEAGEGLFIAPLVPRHIDFLESLIETSRLPLDAGRLREALRRTDILIGSAPVGPTTVKRIRKLCGRYPRVRFGSTEACLQVAATPTWMTEEETEAAFEAGWRHERRGEKIAGYYIGRDHFPFTRLNLVRQIDPGKPDFMEPCETGEPGYLITQGANIMSGYAGRGDITAEVFRDGWYTGLRDIGFALRGKDGRPDFYWVTRDSALLIRGGANYSCEQIAEELAGFLAADFHLKPEEFKLAVVGLRLKSEHEDSCCVTIELGGEAAHMEPKLREEFIARAAGKVSRGSRPDHVRFAKIPVSFKGAVLIPQLKSECSETLKPGGKNG